MCDHHAYWAALGSVLAAGVVYLFATRRRSPRASRLGVMAVVPLLLGAGVVGTSAALVELERTGQLHLDRQTAFTVWMFSTRAFMAVHLVALGLLIRAAMVDHRTPGDAEDESPE